MAITRKKKPQKNNKKKPSRSKIRQTTKAKATDTLFLVAESPDFLDPRPVWDRSALFYVTADSPTVLHFDFAERDYQNAYGYYRTVIFNTIANSEGRLHVGQTQYTAHINTISKYWDSVMQEFQDDDTFIAPCIKSLDQHVAKYREEERERLAATVGKGVVEFDDIPYVFSKGDKVVCSFNGERIAGIFEKAALQRSFFGVYYLISFRVIHALSGSGIEEGVFSTMIFPFRGYKNLSELPIVKLSADEEADLVERGKVYASVVREASYVQYDGQVVRTSWAGQKSFRSTGRVMIDLTSFQQVDSDQWNYESDSTGVETDSRPYNRRTNIDRKKLLEIKPDDLWRTYPFVYGFSFASKQWGRMAVSGLSPITWRDDAFDKLVLEEDRKELVKALVEHQGGTFQDLIDGKGGGVIFMLSGPPGQGKTLTAEAVAELLRRPLYSISVGELGTNPNDLEERLRQILDVATAWDAVLLLDEADIFLEQRTADDIVRNAMVGVFLRLLEYHQGTLFLTSNRVKNVDQAFLSRISVHLNFEKADREKRTKIWYNLLDAASVDTAFAASMAANDLNGRQIKNVIRLSQTLAKARNQDVDQNLLEEVVVACQPPEQQSIRQFNDPLPGIAEQNAA